MRCENCSKFVSLELQDPEIEDLELHDDGSLTGEVRIVRNCAECGSEMKEARFEVNVPAPAVTHKPDCTTKDLHADAELSSLEEGGGRYKKSYFGAEGELRVTCSTCDAQASVKWSDKIDASSMDEV